MPITIVRPPMVLGEGDRLSLPLFRSVLGFHLHFSLGFTPHRFTVIHADDLVQLMILAAERGRRLCPADAEGRPAAQGCYFAACEQDPTYAELGRLVAESVGQQVLVIPTAMPLVRLVTVGAEVLGQIRRTPLIMNLVKVREVSAGSWVCSAAAAQMELGFAVAAPLVERLRQTAEWYWHEGWM